MQCFRFGFLFLCLFTDTIPKVSASTNENKKRLLLTDPDVISQRLVHLESTQQTMLQTIAELQSHIQKQDKIIASHQGSGATYVRWGKSQCPGSAELVYSGYAAGQQYYHPSYSSRWGGPANMLCLPNDPELTNSSYTGGYSFIMGTEYETNDFAHDSINNDVPCAVCRSASSSSSIMIPARYNCYAGWNLEYQGILASGHLGEAASSYVCVDNDPEYLSAGERNENGRLLYVVNIKCVPLPCPPYHNNHKVNCVVCSK